MTSGHWNVTLQKGLYIFSQCILEHRKPVLFSGYFYTVLYKAVTKGQRRTSAHTTITTKHHSQKHRGPRILFISTLNRMINGLILQMALNRMLSTEKVK